MNIAHTQTLALYQMYERGDVRSLDDAFIMYCPDFSIRNMYNSANITLRQMAAQVITSHDTHWRLTYIVPV